MSKVISGIFGGGPSKADTTRLDEIDRRNEERDRKLAEKEKREDEEKASTLRAIRGSRFRGPKTLFALATGTEGDKVQSKDTLGG